MSVKKVISITLMLAVLCSCLSVFAVLPAAAEITNKTYVIFDADPENVSATDGASAKPAWAQTGESYQFGVNATGVGTVRYDEEIPYYSLTFTGLWGSNGAVIENGFNCNNEALGGNFGWLQYRKIIAAIKDYIQVSYDIYVEDTQNRNPYIYVQPVTEWGGNPYDDYGCFDLSSGLAVNQWVNCTKSGFNKLVETADGNPSWACGDLLMSIGSDSGTVDAANPLTVKIRNMRLEVKESDRAAINTALSQVDGINNTKGFVTYFWSDTEQKPNLPKDSAGNIDYFALLAAYDASSAYTSNYSNVTVNGGANGTVSGPQGLIYAGNTVTVSATPNSGFYAEVSAVDGNGSAVVLTDNGDNTYSFIMPSSLVTFTADFAENASYVIWDADPLSIASGDCGGLVAPVVDSESSAYAWSWVDQNRVNFGTATLGYEGAYPYIDCQSHGTGACYGTLINGRWSNTEYLGWTTANDAVKALMPYMNITFDVYIEDSDNGTQTVLTGPAATGDYWNATSANHYGIMTANTIQSNQWVSISQKGWNTECMDQYAGNWNTGDIMVWSDMANSHIKIRNIRISVQKKDRTAINGVLSQISGVNAIKWFTLNWNNEPVIPYDSKGNADYFALLTNFDSSSYLSVNRQTGDVNNDGNLDIRDLVRFKKYTVNAAVAVNYKSADCDSSGGIVFADDLSALRRSLLAG